MAQGIVSFSLNAYRIRRLWTVNCLQLLPSIVCTRHVLENAAGSLAAMACEA